MKIVLIAEIRARAWELLLAMLVMEAAFGIPGVIAAPIYYAYIKYELSARGLIYSSTTRSESRITWMKSGTSSPPFTFASSAASAVRMSGSLFSTVAI